VSDFFCRASALGATKHKILLYGPSKSGKTFGSLRASCDLHKDPTKEVLTGDPGYAGIVFEHQAMQSVKLANPQALVRVIDPTDDSHGDALNQLREFMKMAMDGTLLSMGIHTLALDGLTEIQQIFRDDIIGYDAADDTPFTWDDWRDLNGRMRRFLRTMRGLPFHVVCTALDQEKSDDEGVIRSVRPLLDGQAIRAEVPAYFASVGYAMKNVRTKLGARGTIVEYSTMWDGPSIYKVGASIPLGGVTPTCSGHWIDVLNGATAPEALALALQYGVQGDMRVVHEEREEADVTDEVTAATTSRRRQRAAKE